MKAGWWFAAVVGVISAGGAGLVAAAASAPVLFQSAPGRFEVAAIDSGGGQRVVGLAGEAWQYLAGPLSLPESFSSPVFVRLVPAAHWSERALFRVFAEAGGVVSVRIAWDEATPEPVVRRALVQGLLMRLAVARHGLSEKMAAPLWLEHACVGWWRTRAEPAQLDALKQTSSRLTPPDLAELLDWRRGAAEPSNLAAGSVWLLTFLQSESGRAGEWPGLLQRLLGGEAPLSALAASFPGRFASDEERELWWQTGWHHHRRTRVLPGMEATDSRQELADLTRIVLERDGRDQVMALREVLRHSQEPAVAGELKLRARALNRVLAAMHPFYRNAALSLADVLAAAGASAERREALCATFEGDWQDAIELEAASTRALDALERSRSAPPPR